MMNKYVLASWAILLGFLGAPMVSAHGFATEKSSLVNNYLVNFEYNELGNIPTGKTVYYAFELLDPDGKNFVPFKYASIKFAKDGNVLYTADILETDALDRGMPGAMLSTTFYEPGEYTADVLFHGDSQSLAFTAFDFKVDASVQDSNQSKTPWGLWVMSVITAFILGFVLRGRRKRK